MRRLICSMFAPLCLLLIQSAAAAQTIVLARGGTDQDRFITADGMTSSGDGSFRLASDPDTEIFVVTVLNTHQPVADTSTTELAATLTRTLFLDGNGTSTLLFRGSRATRVSKALEGPHLILLSDNVAAHGEQMRHTFSAIAMLKVVAINDRKGIQ